MPKKILAISTYKLFSEYVIVPEFLFEFDLPHGYLLFYARICKLINHPNHREDGFIRISREELAKSMNLSLSVIDRYIAISKRESLIHFSSTGRELEIAILYHPAMMLSEDQLISNKIDFSQSPNQTKMRNQNLRKSGSSDDHALKDKEDLKEDLKEEESMHAAAPSPSSVENRKPEKSSSLSLSTYSSDQPRRNKPTPLSSFSLQQVTEYAKNEQRVNNTIYNVAAFAYSRWIDGQDDWLITEFLNQPERGLNACQTNKPTQPCQPIANRPEAAKADGNKVLNNGRSRYSQQIYLDYARGQLKEGRKIDSIEKLANWLEKTGQQDDQVGKWLKDRAELSVGQYLKSPTTNNVISKEQEKTTEISPKEKNVETELIEAQLLDEARDMVFDSLDANTKEGLINKKLSDLTKALPREFGRISHEQRIKWAIEEVKKELVPVVDAKS